MLGDWRWWLGVISLVAITAGLPELFAAAFWNETTQVSTLEEGFVRGVYGLLRLAGWVALLAWAAVLLAETAPGADRGGDDAEVPAPVGSGPLREDSVRLPLPEGDADVDGKA